MGRTESGDDVGPYAWQSEPSHFEILATLRGDWPDEFDAFGFDGGISWDLGEVMVRA